MRDFTLAAFSVASLLAAAPLRAQEPPAPKIDVKIVCENWGEPRPRTAPDAGAAAEDGAAFVLVDHRVRWEIGPSRFRSLKSVGAELAGLLRNPKVGPMPVLIQPGPSVCVGDVVLTYDLVREAGFTDVRVGLWNLEFALCRVAADADEAPHFIPPASEKTPAEKVRAWNPKITFRQHGRIELDGEVIYAPDQEKSLAEAGRELLSKLLAEARGRGLVRFDPTKDPPREVMHEPLLIRADKWTEWHYVSKVLEQCSATDATFPGFRLGVTEKDGEEELLRRR